MMPPRGVTIFTEGLRELGYEPIEVPGQLDCVVFDYVVESGKFAGQKVRLGFIVPVDFPNTTPSGPHVSPLIHPDFAGGTHPTGGIHRSHSVPFAAVGGQWQYWSRPFPMNEWPRSKKTTGTYMSHIWRLWDTQ